MYTFILIVHIILLIASIVFIGVVLVEKANDTTKYLFCATICSFLTILGYIQELLGIDILRRHRSESRLLWWI